MRKVSFAVIGVGAMGSIHVRNIHTGDNCRLAAVCDTDPAAFDRIAPDIRKEIVCCRSAEELWQVEGVDAVLIAVPHYDHPDLAIAAMEHGKHVIVEKPIAVHKADAVRLLEAGKKHPELVQSAMFCMRTIPIYRKIKHLIDAGELGRIRRICWTITSWFRSQRYYDSGGWRATWSGEGGGVLLNQCPHQLDLMQWFFGMPETVRAAVKLGKYHRIEVEDEVNAYLEYADGKTANFITTTGEAPGTNRLEIAGDRGRLVCEDGKLEFRRNEIRTADYIRTTSEKMAPPPCWTCSIPVDNVSFSTHLAIVRNVASAILDGTELIAPLSEGIRGLELGNAMLFSGLTGKEVKLPLDAGKYEALLRRLIARSARKTTRKK